MDEMALEMAAQYNYIAENRTITIDAEQSSRTKNGKKREKREIEPKGERGRRRVKVHGDPNENHKILIKKQKAQEARALLKVTSSKQNSTDSIEPKWNVLQPVKTCTPPDVARSQEQPSLTGLKPRIWTGSREEVVALLPDLAGPKCLNGVSWLMYETPMVLLDESTTCFDIYLQEDSVTLDLFTTREFTCSRPPRPEKVPDSPEGLTVNDALDGNHSNLGPMVTSSNKKIPKTRQTKQDFPTATTIPATGSTNTQTEPEGAFIDSVGLQYTRSIKSEQFDAPSVPIYRQDQPSSSQKLIRGQTIKATGSTTNFSAPSLVPIDRMHNPLAGSVDEPLPNARSNRGIDDIAVTNYQIEPDYLHSAKHIKPTTQPQTKGKSNTKVLQDTFIPSTIPEEIQAIIDSYLSGRPVLLVISNKRFSDYWSLRLPEEFGFFMLGYFRILGVQESRVHLTDPVRPLNDSPGLMVGLVKWCFRLQWSPGGEEWILPNHDKKLLEHPWWKPPSSPSISPLDSQIPPVDTQSSDNLTTNHALSASQEKLAVKPVNPPLVIESQLTGDTAPFEPESTFDTTLRYKEARLSNVNYRFRHARLRELYHSHVPLQLLAPYGRMVLDSSFPRGWLCETCGKMNFQAALRHRACSSSFCKGLKPQFAPYAIDLIFMRDPQDNLPMVLPYNEPLLIDLVDTWEDGTRTLPYYIHENVFIKHIFSRNLPQLQREATRLLHLIQVDVELIRPIGENSPYFQYSAQAPKDDPSPTTSEWPDVPLCIHHAKDWTQHQAIWFGELKEDQLSINHLCLLGWVTSGTKRGPATIRAKEKCVVFHAFGCNVTVMVTPLSCKTTAPVKINEVDIDHLISMDGLPVDEPDVNPGWIAGDDDDEVEDPSQDNERQQVTNSKASNSNRSYLFTLIHGDVLVLYGDDFEYSLKRGGTSFLLIASHQNEP